MERVIKTAAIRCCTLTCIRIRRRSADEPSQAPRSTAATANAVTRCGDTVEVRRLGEQSRLLYWCPGCQVHRGHERCESADERPMDPHPAAAKFLCRAAVAATRHAGRLKASGLRDAGDARLLLQESPDDYVAERTRLVKQARAAVRYRAAAASIKR